MNEEVIKKGKTIISDPDYIYSMYDFSVIWINEDIYEKYGFNSMHKESLTLFDIFEMPQSKTNQLILESAQSEITELTLSIVGKGKCNVKTKNINFRYDGELFRVGKILKIKNCKK